MSIREMSGNLIDFSDDTIAQLGTFVKLTKPESACVANTIRTLDNSRHRKTAANLESRSA